MRTLFLTSSGLTPEIADEVLKRIDKEPSGVKVGYVPTASDHKDQGFMLKDKAAFEALGITDFVDVDIKDPENHALLDDCDIVYVRGGNTFYLLKWVRESGFDRKLKDLIKEGKIYIGESAGSVMMGTSIEIAGIPGYDKNEIGLEDTRGLRRAPFMIAPHMDPTIKFEVSRFSATKPLQPIIGIADGQAILGEDDRFQLIGPGKAERWNSKLFK